jgi:diguanylate cyclase
LIEDDSPERSAEILRLALPLMSKHAPGFQPVSYALWYQYAHGGNGALRTEVDEALRDEQRLSLSRTQVLYQRHLIDGAEQAFTRARAGLLDVLTSVQGSVDLAAGNTADFNDSLASFGDELAGCDRIEDMRAKTAAMAAQAGQVSESLRQLDGALAGSRGEIQQLTEALARMREEADTDALTGLRNRRGFDRELARLASEGNLLVARTSLLILDIDHFKRVNDTCGHLFGDRVLQGVARAVASMVKGRDLAARIGGEEFAVLLPETELAGALRVADQIRLGMAGIRIRRPAGEKPMDPVTVSVGVAQRLPSESLESWFERADKALYKAKNKGRNRVEKAD